MIIFLYLPASVMNNIFIKLYIFWEKNIVYFDYILLVQICSETYIAKSKSFNYIQVVFLLVISVKVK